ncbi:hypothetical protein HAX54_013983 [Datura stramonium]|uniref:Uncharacterized protein n=1 Tax=Datura stramonium TaxID=4076 RepID=A0ABS8RZ83_DATST|nr:hypothetical protein [Datura stramonium]
METTMARAPKEVQIKQGTRARKGLSLFRPPWDFTHEETEGRAPTKWSERITTAEVKDVDEAIVAAESLTDFRSESTKAKEAGRRPVAAKVDPGERERGKSVANRGRDGKGDCSRSSQFRKDYEERKKGVNH